MSEVNPVINTISYDTKPSLYQRRYPDRPPLPPLCEPLPPYDYTQTKSYSEKYNICLISPEVAMFKLTLELQKKGYDFDPESE
jgi:hypothetical protein